MALHIGCSPVQPTEPNCFPSSSPPSRVPPYAFDQNQLNAIIPRSSPSLHALASFNLDAFTHSATPTFSIDTRPDQPLHVTCAATSSKNKKDEDVSGSQECDYDIEAMDHRISGKYGFEWDVKNGYDLEWVSFADFNAWLLKEQNSHGVEFTVKEHKPNKAPLDQQVWHMKHVYVCSRQGSGGKKNYECKTNHSHKISHK
ncbi:uncharacterized protein EV420DRAFT_1649798 [Desarmillaria tabescens]|uniref:Uncharacterized protein n=1 Tax=Armillaria tabescens TaxID=1929756 RepID=A0AA39JFT9_ARMTA|nr:uncharacterized protein EV420DRAFT_1649798 [Desarmillaria tabescens]KAK0442000.1 hypothetical protein EV420DRAFT_1649798 [Desarmillaria tabescens]